MTQRQSNRSRVLRRIGIALATTLSVSTLASTAAGAASKPAVGAHGGIGDVKVATGDTWGGFCVGQNLNNSALGGARTIYETIVEKSKGGDYIPMLAKSWTSSADLKTWTFSLREGVKFHDGADWNADSMVQNFKALSGRALSETFWGTAAAVEKAAATAIPFILGGGKSSAMPAAGVVWTLTADYTIKPASMADQITDDIKLLKGDTLPGALVPYWNGDMLRKKYTPGKLTTGQVGELSATIAMSQKAGFTAGTAIAFAGNISSITKVDNMTVKLTLDRPQNDFPGTLYASGRFTMRGPSQLANATDCANKPVGTGPFKVAANYDRSVVGDRRLPVIRNQSYWRKDAAGKALPYLNSITFTTVKEASTRSVAVRKGTYDAAQFITSTEGKFVLDLRNNNKQFVTELDSGNEYYPSLWLNQAKPGTPFANKDARLAVLHCLDRVNYVKTRTFGATKVATGLVEKQNPMYFKGIHKFDVALSKRYAAAYKKTTGKQLEFGFPSDTSASAIANSEFFKKQWAKCGIKANYVKEESYLIIQKAWSAAATSLATQNAYDAFFAVLFEGTDTTFNLPFIKSNSFDYKLAQVPSDKDPETAADGPLTERAAGGPAGASPATLFRFSLGSLLQLNKHSDTALDEMLYTGQAQATKKLAAAEYAKASKYIVDQGYMGSVATLSFSMFMNKKSKLSNIGVVKLPEGKTQRTMSNWGIDWVGVKKG
jgi:ABC-type transport system substrate-binding protein